MDFNPECMFSIQFGCYYSKLKIQINRIKCLLIFFSQIMKIRCYCKLKQICLETTTPDRTKLVKEGSACFTSCHFCLSSIQNRALINVALGHTTHLETDWNQCSLKSRLYHLPLLSLFTTLWTIIFLLVYVIISPQTSLGEGI